MLLEIAESKDSGAQLRQVASFVERAASYFLGRFFFARGLDLLPIVVAIPLAVRPMLDLIDPPGLHGIPPFPCSSGYEPFLTTIGLHGASMMESGAAFSPDSSCAE